MLVFKHLYCGQQILFISTATKPKKYNPLIPKSAIWHKKPLLDQYGPFAARGHMVHAGGQAAHWDIQNKENSNLY